MILAFACGPRNSHCSTVCETLTSLSGPPSLPCQVAVSVWRILKPAALLEGGNDHFTHCCYRFMVALSFLPWLCTLIHLSKPLTIGRPVPDGQVRGWKIFVSDLLWGTSEASMWLMQGLLVTTTTYPGSSPDVANLRPDPDTVMSCRHENLEKVEREQTEHTKSRFLNPPSAGHVTR